MAERSWYVLSPDRKFRTMASSEGARWYVCHTRSRHEKKVDRLLAERGFETFLPVARQVRRWKDRRKAVEFVMFPGYTFVRASLTDIGRVLATTGVVDVVRSGGAPVAVAHDDVDNVRRLAAAFAQTDIESELVPLPTAGARVRITSGPFQGIDAVVVDQRGSRRLLVGFEVIGQALRLDLDANSLEILH